MLIVVVSIDVAYSFAVVVAVVAEITLAVAFVMVQLLFAETSVEANLSD